MAHFTPQSRRAVVSAVPALTLIGLLTACSGDGASSAARRAKNTTATAAADTALPPCAGRDTTALRAAVLSYITTTEPRPQRFLSPFGTDSTLPEDGFLALQDKGPTYYWNDNPKNQQQVRDKLDAAGPYATMLVVYKGRTESDNGRTVTVTLGGHYVGGELEGKVAPVRAITVRCDSTGWRVPK